MKINVAIIENNIRRNDEVIVNGISVEIMGANLVGSEKQVAWAEKIIAEAIKVMASGVIEKAGNSGAEIDALVGKLNTGLAPMSKLAGTKASDWIDNRHLGAGVIAHMMRKA